MIFRNNIKYKVSVTLMSQKYIIEDNKRVYIGLINTMINDNPETTEHFVFRSNHKLTDYIINNMIFYVNENTNRIFTKDIHFDMQKKNTYSSVTFPSFENKYGISPDKGKILVNITNNKLLTLISILNTDIHNLNLSLKEIQEAS